MPTPAALLHPLVGSKPPARTERLGENARVRRPKARTRSMTTAYEFSFAKLKEPGEIKFADYAGKAILVVNVASACGFTPQYRDLEQLYEAKVGKGLVVV